MTERPEDGWAAATREGSRRAQIRRALELTPRQRLEAMLQLGETGQQLAAAPRRTGNDPAPTDADARVGEESAGYGDVSPAGPHEVPLPGCGPIPLAGYLKALGLLRLVAEQADPAARGYWEDEQFILCSRLDAAGLRQFLLEEYQPTPLLAPWGARSGFYPGSAESGARKVLESILETESERLGPYRKAIDSIKELLEEHGFEEKPSDDERKLQLMRLCRAELDEELVQWLDACFTLTAEWRRFPPLLGTGGNEGSGSYLSGFGQLVVECLHQRKCDSALEASLFEASIPAADTSQVPGQFAPSMAGGANQGTGYSGDVTTNPWDYLLALEGTLLFASASTRRLGSQDAGSASFPFTTQVTGAGSGSTATADEEGSRAEMWLPLWHGPASMDELLGLLSEGRVTLGRKPVRDGLDFARAIAHLGADRGINAFQRYTFIQRYGRNVFAVPLNRIIVQRNPASELISDLDAGNWLNRFRRYARAEGANRVLSLNRRLEDALFELTTTRDDQAPVLRRLLVVLGEIQLYLARSPKARESCPPVPSLSGKWFARADDGSAEMALAAALAGLHARGREGQWLLPMRAHLAPEQSGRRPAWDENAHHDVTWHAGADVADNLAGSLRRRLLQAEMGELPDKPLQPARTAPLADVAAWVAGEVDEQRLAELLPGLMLVRIPGGGGRAVERSAPLPAAYRLLKPLFCIDEQLHRSRLLPPEASLPLEAGILRRLESGDVAGALEQGMRRLRVAGLRTGLHAPAPGTRQGRRLLAALMVPVSDAALQSLLRLETEEDPSETTLNH
ncbi:MAG: type I-U CRISPR-associated protein Csx17 [Thiohalospira sp.]